jgi:hypothetical protein
VEWEAYGYMDGHGIAHICRNNDGRKERRKKNRYYEDILFIKP